MKRYRNLKDVPPHNWRFAAAISFAFSLALLCLYLLLPSSTLLGPLTFTISQMQFAMYGWIGIRCRLPIVFIFGMLNFSIAAYVIVPQFYQLF